MASMDQRAADEEEKVEDMNFEVDRLSGATQNMEEGLEELLEKLTIMFNRVVEIVVVHHRKKTMGSGEPAEETGGTSAGN